MIRLAKFVFALILIAMLGSLALAQMPADQFGFGAAIANQGATSDALSAAEQADIAAAAVQSLATQDLESAQLAADSALTRVDSLRAQVDEWWSGLSNERVAAILAIITVAETPMEVAPVPVATIEPAIPTEAPVDPPADEPVDDGTADQSDG